MKFPQSLLRGGLHGGLLIGCVLFSSCKDKNTVQVYRVSKAEVEAPAPQAANPAPENAGMPPMGASMQPAPATGQASLFTGNPPANWEQQPLSSMRQASYLVKGENGATADISLVILAGSAGGTLDNANRWLAQLGQPAITEEQLAKMARRVTSSLGEVTLVDLQGTPQGGNDSKDGRIVAGIASGDNKTYFFKMRGNAALAESQKEAFIQWIGTVRPAEAAPGSPAHTPVASAAPVAPVAPVPSAAEQPKQQITWSLPENWKSLPPSSMRYASFTVAGKNGETADISVSVFGGDGGGDLANVNRWRSQIGLQEIDAEALKALVVPVTCKDAQILSVDMNSPKGRILAGWARVDGKSWFFKLTATAQLEEEEKAAFAKFLQSIQFHP